MWKCTYTYTVYFPEISMMNFKSQRPLINEATSVEACSREARNCILDENLQRSNCALIMPTVPPEAHHG